MEEIDMKEFIIQLEGKTEICEEFIEEVKETFKRYLKKKQALEKKFVETIIVDVESRGDLKDYIFSRKIMVKKGVYQGKNYLFDYTEAFREEYELKRRREQKEKMRKSASRKKESDKVLLERESSVQDVTK